MPGYNTLGLLHKQRAAVGAMAHAAPPAVPGCGKNGLVICLFVFGLVKGLQREAQ